MRQSEAWIATQLAVGQLDRRALALYRGVVPLKLELNPEIEASLTALAQAQGLSL